MRPSMDKIIFLLMMLVKINELESRAILGCSCAKSVPLAVTIPVAPPPLQVPCPTHGYKIEVPPPPVLVAPTPPCALDVVVEAPLPVVPPPVCNPNLITPLVKPALLADDCGVPAVVPAPCGGCGACAACKVPALPPAPAPLALPAAPAPPLTLSLPFPFALPPAALPLPLAPALPDDFSGVAPLKAPLPAPITYQLISTALPAAPPATLPPAYTLPLAPPVSPCGCALPKPDCRYVLKGIKSNHINKIGGRSKRDVNLKHQKCLDEIREYIESLKSTRVTRKAKKSKLVKRDIKGEYDLLQRDQYEMDLTIPEIIQYMPETMLPNFKRGKCSIGCKNCINNDLNKQLKQFNSAQPTEITNKENNKPSTEQQAALNENTTESPNQQFDNISNPPQSAATGENYTKRSVNPFQNPNPSPSYSGLMPPPYTACTMELSELAKNPGNPVWFQPQPLTDLNVDDYVYDRLGHKYKVKNGSFKLVTPTEQNDEDDVVNRSTHVASAGENAEKTIDEAKALESSSVQNDAGANEQMIDLEAQKMHHSAANQHRHADVNAPQVAINDQTSIIVGAPSAHQQNPSSDQHMDKVIRDIVYRHPDFIDATQHAPGSLTLPEEVTRDETVQFLDKLIKGRLNKWFGPPPSEDVPMHRLQDLNRYSRETGTTIKFIPIVTVDKNRLNEFRQTKLKEIS